MVLDTSRVVDENEDPEQLAKARFEKVVTVQEYAAEIYTYLRKAEVRKGSLNQAVDAGSHWCMLTLFFFFFFFIPAEESSSCRVHEETAWYHNQHAKYPGWLVGGSGWRVQTHTGDTLPLSQLHWSIPLPDVCS